MYDTTTPNPIGITNVTVISEPPETSEVRASSQHDEYVTRLTKEVDVTIEATTEQHNIKVDNPSTASMKEEKVEPVSLGEQKNYLFEEFSISDEAPKKLTKLINDYLEWIVDGPLKHHIGRFCQQLSKVSQNKKCLINIIKGFSIPAVLQWHLDDEVYIPINCGDEFHWVLVVVEDTFWNVF
ncbi:hypothetical protein CQW23_07536 [Capsicum baccatum]|uniref:Ubiquitin-like protease family profile domain-containing protein n=1 Tax=Capsicum baccatum TaxID=33114 RepID=A0A2G2X6E1_CAPBA|nr:hypothetical protein CQW23_07536 [Capsicum baccatum]